MHMSLVIGSAPLGLGVLIALGGILVMMSYLSEWSSFRRQLFANAAMAASRVAAYPWVGVRSSWCPNAKVHSHGVPAGDAAAFMMRPTTLGEHVIVVIVPLAGGARSWCALEDQIIFFHLPNRRRPGALLLAQWAIIFFVAR
jgi:hypothetical protein